MSPLLRFFLFYSILMTLFGAKLARAGDCPDTNDVSARIICEAKAENIVDKDGYIAVEASTLESSIHACTQIHRPTVYNVPHKD